MSRTLMCFCMVFLVSNASAKESSSSGDRGIEGQYLVKLYDDQIRDFDDTTSKKPSVEQAIALLAAKHGGATVRIWEQAVKGALLEISQQDALALSQHPWVELVEKNRVVVSEALLGGAIVSCSPVVGLRTTSVTTGGISQPIDCTELDPRNPNYDCPGNWGLDRVDQGNLPRDGFFDYESTGQGVHVYIIDTGVNDFPAEFGDRIARDDANVTITAPFDSLRFNTFDCVSHAHGTHVTGIIGSTTYGLAKDAALHPVKFLDYCECGNNTNPADDCNDNNTPYRGGTAAHVVAALDYIISHRMLPAVVNMSGANVDGWDGIIAACVQELLEVGIQFVQAAGNQDDFQGGSVACDRTIGDEVPDAIVVGGTDINEVGGELIDGRWRREGQETTGGTPDPGYSVWCDPDPPGGELGDCGSNTGTCIDIWAPASHITSTAGDASGGCRLSGTSMAAPHVTGAVALYLEENPGATPQQVQQAIIDRAVTGVLEDSVGSPYSIGNSPNRLLYSGPNRPPVATDDSFSFLWQTQVVGRAAVPVFTGVIPFATLLANDTDPDQDPLSVCGLADPEYGTLDEDAEDSVTYIPPGGCLEDPLDSFEYTVCDGRGGEDTGEIQIDLGGGAPCPPTS